MSDDFVEENEAVSSKYREYSVMVSETLKNRFIFVREFFKNYHKINPSIPYEFRRRKLASEFFETSLLILNKISAFYDCGVSVYVGSRYLYDKPYAVFGEDESIQTTIKFKRMESIFIDYQKYAQGMDTHTKVPCRYGGDLVSYLAKKHNKSDYIIGYTAVALTSDLLFHCGPDCPELFEFFENDCRVSKTKLNLEAWESLRVLTIPPQHSGILKTPYQYHLGQVGKKRYLSKKKNAVKFVKSTSNGIEDGENSVLLAEIKNYKNFYKGKQSTSSWNNYTATQQQPKTTSVVSSLYGHQNNGLHEVYPENENEYTGE